MHSLRCNTRKDYGTSKERKKERMKQRKKRSDLGIGDEEASSGGISILRDLDTNYFFYIFCLKRSVDYLLEMSKH